jgi:hypothetical protein
MWFYSQAPLAAGLGLFRTQWLYVMDSQKAKIVRNVASGTLFLIVRLRTSFLKLLNSTSGVIQ